MNKFVCDSPIKTLEKFLKQSFYTLAGLPILYHLGNSWRGRVCVLCYHRVLPDEQIEKDESPNSSLVMPASRFAEQMEFLSYNYEILSIDGLAEHLEVDSNKFVVAVTFDDGYKDNLIHALPILERFRIPATIYITTRFAEGDTWMWWYEIWDHIKSVEYLELNYSEKHFNFEVRTLRQKINCFEHLCDWLMTFPYKEQRKAIGKLTNETIRKQYPHLCLNWDEIKLLDKNPFITVGAHTHNHPNLKQLTEEEAFIEMQRSEALLEQELGHPIKHFAYPFGTAKEAGTREFELAYRCGFRTAVTTRSEKFLKQTLIQIPRLGVPPYLTLRGFQGKLSGWELFIRQWIL